MTAKYTHADFTRLLLVSFPELQQEILEGASEGLLHMEMSEFANLLQRAKGNADWDTYRRGVDLADRLWSNPDDALLNALNVSFFEHLDFNGPRGKAAWELLTPSLQRGWIEMQEYLDHLAKGAKPGLFRPKSSK